MCKEFNWNVSPCELLLFVSASKWKVRITSATSVCLELWFSLSISDLLLENESLLCADCWLFTSHPTGSCRRTWCAHTQQVTKLCKTHVLVKIVWQRVSIIDIYISIISVTLLFVGVGNPLSPERTRMLLALRINVLAKGHSGISLETLHAMIQAFNGKPPTSFYLNWPGISASVQSTTDNFL